MSGKQIRADLTSFLRIPTRDTQAFQKEVGLSLVGKLSKQKCLIRVWFSQEWCLEPERLESHRIHPIANYARRQVTAFLVRCVKRDNNRIYFIDWEVQVCDERVTFAPSSLRVFSLSFLQMEGEKWSRI